MEVGSMEKSIKVLVPQKKKKQSVIIPKQLQGTLKGWCVMKKI